MDGLLAGFLMAIGIGHIVGTQPVETQTYEIQDFYELKIEGDFNVIVEQGDKYLVEVTTNADIFEFLNVSLDDDTLVIKEKNNINIENTNIDINIVCPEISYIKLASSADMTILDTLECSEIEIDINSSANLSASNLKIDNEANIYLSSSADITILDTLECSELDIGISSSANLSAANLKVDNDATIELSSSADMNISDMFECSELDIDISSSANLSANNVNTKTCVIDGHSSSELLLVGNTSELYLDLSSSSKALLSNFIVENAEVELSSSAKTEINATNNIYLDANSGSEIIVYNGNLILADKDNYNGVKIKRK